MLGYVTEMPPAVIAARCGLYTLSVGPVGAVIGGAYPCSAHIVYAATEDLSVVSVAELWRQAIENGATFVMLGDLNLFLHGIMQSREEL